jgi:hypothetical protein
VKRVGPWLALWGLVVACGFGYLYRYKSAAGRAADAPRTWPASSALAREPGRPTLLMIAHPRCPCTRASLTEFSGLATTHPDAQTFVIFVKPAGTEPGWEDSDTLRRAREIPGAHVVIDDDGREAARFGAFVSGQTYLFAPDGALEFSGGLTASRGHEGDSFGRRRVAALLEARSADRSDAPVFGCPLSAEETR